MRRQGAPSWHGGRRGRCGDTMTDAVDAAITSPSDRCARPRPSMSFPASGTRQDGVRADPACPLRQIGETRGNARETRSCAPRRSLTHSLRIGRTCACNSCVAGGGYSRSPADLRSRRAAKTQRFRAYDAAKLAQSNRAAQHPRARTCRRAHARMGRAHRARSLLVEEKAGRTGTPRRPASALGKS